MTSFIEKHPNIIQECESKEKFNVIFQRLIANAEKNLKRHPQQVRHDILLKKFATSLYIYCGSRAYNFISSNIPRALPSLRTIQRFVAADYHPIGEGCFRFDELLNHLNAFKCQKVVALGEDATRVIKKIQYDPNTNKLVGFVLPCDESGLPLCDSFMATTFESMENYFCNESVANYAFVYMVQPLAENVPAFCLSCLGTNNKFDAEIVLKRWNYIYSELKKRDINLLSIGADGDSRELKAMQVSAQLLSKSAGSLSLLSPSSDKINIPLNWSSWFAIKRPTSISFIQDPVHVAVKLKSRLLRPSIVLPLGKYIAGSHHLQIIHSTFSKDQHGLRVKDIDHKDRQNYEAVLRITSTSVMGLLTHIPDAKGTVVYLKLMKAVTDSFLDKSLECLLRIEKAWYSVFVLRYWRQYVVLSPEYNLADNFITSNAYTCVELNAHSLITFVLSLQTIPSVNRSFYPWMLGSQCCEKMFRAARSMSSVFSTVINFGMLGLLQRIHRLHIQSILESESEETTIKYHHAESHKKKDGHSCANLQHLHIHSITLQDISKTVEKACEMAKETINKLGMSELLHKHNSWDTPPICFLQDEEFMEDDDQYEDELNEGLIDEENIGVDPEEVSSGITELSNAKIIDKEMTNNLNALHSASFKKLKNPGLPIYHLQLDSSKKQEQKHKHSHFVEVSCGDKAVYIHKTIAVWLLQETERVSTDRLFRVRNKQPFATQSNTSKIATSSAVHPIVCSSISVGDMCIFKTTDQDWKVGRVLQFSNYLEKLKSAQQYRGLTANVANTKVGVLCSWYTISDTTSQIFSLSQKEVTYVHIPINMYLCTLPTRCFRNLEDVNMSAISNNISKINDNNAKLLMLEKFILDSNIMQIIQNIFQDDIPTVVESKKTPKPTDSKTESESKHIVNEPWIKCGRIALSKKDKQQIVNGKELTDMHINAFQSLARESFPLIGGLHNTLLLDKTSLAVKNYEQSLQIVHIPDRSHWALLYR